MSKWVVFFGVLLFSTVPLLKPGYAQFSSFLTAGEGCAMAHCDPQMSDFVGKDVPTGQIGVLWHDQTAAGSNYGLGCSSNGKSVACSLGGNSKAGPYLKVYDPDGKVLWTSNLLNVMAWTSAPMIDEEGGVIAADSERVVRFDPAGEVLWQTKTPGGLPISPVITENGTVVLATLKGPISAYDNRSGQWLATLELPGIYRGRAGFFETRNTPTVNGNRIYALTEFRVTSGQNPPDRPARLYAIDINPDAPEDQRLNVVWFFEFGARSGSSPLFIDGVVFFDGDRLTPDSPEDPHFFAVADINDSPVLKWTSPLPEEGFASAARDPRGGVWVFGREDPHLLRLSETTGEVLQNLNVNDMIQDPVLHAPLSAMSIAKGPQGQPVMLVIATAIVKTVFGSHYLLAIDLESEIPLWKYRYGFGFRKWGAGQFPIVQKEEQPPVVVFTTFANGVIGLSHLR